MTSRLKTSIIIGSTLIGLIVALYAAASLILLGGFAKIEERYAYRNVEQALNALDENLSRVDYITRDWASWGETDRFVRGDNADYIASSLNNTSLAGIGMDLIVYLDASKKIVYATGYDRLNQRKIPCPPSFKSLLFSHPRLVNHSDPASMAKGLLLLPEGPLLLSSRPVIINEGKGPVRGTLLMGKYLDAAEIQRLSDLTQLSIETYRLDQPLFLKELKEVRDRLAVMPTIITRPEDAETIAGYAMMSDLYGKPGLLIRVNNQRFIYQQGQTSVFLFIFCLLMIGLVLGGGIQWLMERLQRSEKREKLSEERHRAVVEQASEGILLVDVETKRFTETNASFQNLLGYTRDDLMRMSLYEVDPFNREGIDRAVAEVLHGTGIQKMECRYLRKDASMVDVEVIVSRITFGESEALSIVVRDITERKRAEEELRGSEERYALSARAVNDGLWDWDMRTNHVYFSDRWKAMLGYDEDEVGPSLEEWFKRVHPKDAEHLKSRLAHYLQTADTHFELEYRIQHKDGNFRWALTRGLAVRDEDGKLYRMAGSQTDITDRKKSEDQLRYDAFHDALTDLPNRTLFLDRLDRSIMRAKQGAGYQYAILFLDLDRFKVINDGLGHLVGDQLLIMMAQRLKTCVRPSDTVARFGGDEFVLLLEEIKDGNDAVIVANRVMEEMKTPFYVMGHEIFTSASVGIAMGTLEYENSEDLLRDADTAMYRAKVLGKGRHETFDTEMRTHAVMMLEMESDLWRAMERNEFELFYQPIVTVDTGQITGCEALVYWQHPHRGLVSPGEFIPVAEETGLIETLGEWVLRTACAQARKWHEMGHTQFRVAVNCSARQFQPHLPDTVRKALQETGLSPHSLTIEVTESLAMKDVEASIAILKELNRLGIRISIDDFGTGYSSLGYLNRLPIHNLKIDRSFVSEISENADNTVISEMIISMAHSLNLKVVAEGVENESQLEFLRSQNCDEMQGFFFSRPLSTERLTQMLMTESMLSSVISGR